MSDENNLDEDTNEPTKITPQLVRDVADKVYDMIKRELKTDIERSRVTSVKMGSRQGRQGGW